MNGGTTVPNTGWKPPARGLPVKDAAHRLSMTVQAVRKHIRNGKIPVRQYFNGRTEVWPLVIQALVEGATVEQAHAVHAAIEAGWVEKKITAIWRKEKP